ncbi:MAG TPA: ADP-glyceromanno-heptose 6-epimerase [Candidatus Desulfovibrio gallistercoris]|uniref:ADP-glyceromanno-heptose 6-epimerase n=1 Tax=uncultured Desulfovibrio sp. TaxID=167968 RepID=UPI001F84C881|nr:ADP-glyceromanno-heptose 6-epimerase [uncultured Desulfovibrio sp.]HJA75452.1 ADP-glyceromanno-heptose 6-epimerase [Candidatus Desulfovibrio gallistercoris]
MYIITGGAGFIGSAMLWQLNQQGIDDVVLVDHLGTDDKWRNLVKLTYADYIHRERFRDLLQRDALPWKVEAIIHLGACSDTTEADGDFLMENNFQFSRDICRYALDKGARFIQASSAATYGDGSLGFSDDPDLLPKLRPLNLYAYSKHLLDLWLVRHGLDKEVASLKFFNVYGPNEYHKGEMRSVACKAYKQITKHGDLELFRSTSPDISDGEQKRDFVYVKDCTALMSWLLENRHVNGIHNVGSGRARSFNDLGRAVFSAMQRSCRITYVDMPRMLHGKYQNFTQADMNWLDKVGCPIKMTSLEDGVTDFVQNYLSQPDPYL